MILVLDLKIINLNIAGLLITHLIGLNQGMGQIKLLQKKIILNGFLSIQKQEYYLLHSFLEKLIIIFLLDAILLM